MKAMVLAGVKTIIYRDEYLRMVDAEKREREEENHSISPCAWG